MLTAPSPPSAVRDLTRQFGDRCSMHGVGRALSPNTRIGERLFWSLLVLAMSIWALHSVLSSIRLYYEYPVSTVITQDFSPPLRFPGVTFCNMNRMRKSKMSNKTYDIINQALGWSTSDTRVELTRQIKGLLDSLPSHRAIAAGHSLTDTLVSCVFDSRICGPANFTAFFNPVYGNCFVFGSNLLSVSNPGKLSGLTLDLNAEVEEYTPLASSLGIKVLLHDPRTMPFPQDAGFTATTGQVTSIGFTEKRVEMLSEPYSDCLTEGYHPRLNIFSQSGYLYNRESCMRSNFQKQLMKVCGCCSKWYPCDRKLLRELSSKKISGQTWNESTMYCVVPSLAKDVTYRSSQACYLTQLQQIGQIDLMSGCPQPCSNVLYQTTVSASHLPIRDLLFFERQFHPNLATLERLQRQPSIVRVEVYFKDMLTERMVAVPVLDGNKLLGNIGGQLGLLLGFSLVTAVEILELLINLATAAVLKLRVAQLSTVKVGRDNQDSKEGGNADNEKERGVDADM